MSEKILFIHHHELMWEDGFKRQGTSFDEQNEAILDHLIFGDQKYDRIIVTNMENITPPEEIAPLIAFCENNNVFFDFQTYGYGMIRDDSNSEKIYPLEKLNDTWCFGNRYYHTEEDVLDIEDWMKELKGHDVVLIGAFKGECLNDMEQIFDSINISYNKIPELCVGENSPSYEKKGEVFVANCLSEFQPIIIDIEDSLYDLYENNDIEDLKELMETSPKEAYQHISLMRETLELYIDKVEDSGLSYEDIESFYPSVSELSFEESFFEEMFEDIREDNDKTQFEIAYEKENDRRKQKSNAPSLSLRP